MLDAQQKATLKAHILANVSQDVVDGITNGDVGTIASHYNGAASPEFVVWKTSVTQDEIMQNGFDWSRVDNLANGPARIWEWMFQNESRSVDPSKINVRAGIEAVWKGTAADLAVRAAVYVHCRRVASVFEKLFATGTGTAESPGTMAIEGPVSITDISETLAS